MKTFFRYLKRIGWVLLIIFMLPIFLIASGVIFMTSPLIIAIRYIIKWDGLYESFSWYDNVFIENTLGKLFGWIFIIKPN